MALAVRGKGTYLDDVEDERGDEHGVELVVVVAEDVTQAALRTVLRHHAHVVLLDAGADERIQVVVTYLAHLRHRQQHTSLSNTP